MFDASQTRDTSQQMLMVRMREAELRAAWRQANAGRRGRPVRLAPAGRFRGAIAGAFIRIGQAATELGRAVGRTEAA